MPASQTPVTVSGERIAQLRASTGHSRELLCDSSPLLRRLQNRTELTFRVRLPSYRSLPLSCIESLHVAVDGVGLATADAELVIDGVPFRVSDCGRLSQVWWFILDEAVVRMSAPDTLAPGTHQLDVALARVEPYITAGRFTFTTRCAKRLAFVAEPS